MGNGPLGCETNCPVIDAGTLVLQQSEKPDVKKGADAAAKRAQGLQMQEADNCQYLPNTDDSPFLKAIAFAEEGDYNLKFGGVKGKQNDPW